MDIKESMQVLADLEESIEYGNMVESIHAHEILAEDAHDDWESFDSVGAFFESMGLENWDS